MRASCRETEEPSTSAEGSGREGAEGGRAVATTDQSLQVRCSGTRRASESSWLRLAEGKKLRHDIQDTKTGKGAMVKVRKCEEELLKRGVYQEVKDWRPIVLVVLVVREPRGASW